MKAKPLCSVCIQEGRSYSVTEPLYGVTTLMAVTPGYWDEKEVYHPPFNPNITTYSYSCSNGHSWSSNE